MLRVGCSAVISTKIAAKYYSLNAQTMGVGAYPGGQMEAGESASEACEREVWEETGLKVRATRLLGVYSDPDQLVILQ